MSIVIEVVGLVAVVMGAWWWLRRRDPGLRVARVAATVLGVYAGLVGAAHGYYEIRQGNAGTGGLAIEAIGGSCDAESTWHACLPAITLIPNFLLTGVLVVMLAAIIIVWATAFVHRHRHGGRILIGLAVALLLVGGGFFPPFYGAIGGVFGMRLHPTDETVAPS